MSYQSDSGIPTNDRGELLCFGCNKPVGDGKNHRCTRRNLAARAAAETRAANEDDPTSPGSIRMSETWSRSFGGRLADGCEMLREVDGC